MFIYALLMDRKYNYPCFGNAACSSHYAYNMIWHEMAYSHFICTRHRVESGVYACYWLFTILGEYVVSSEMGRRLKLRLTVS